MPAITPAAGHALVEVRIASPNPAASTVSRNGVRGRAAATGDRAQQWLRFSKAARDWRPYDATLLYRASLDQRELPSRGRERCMPDEDGGFDVCHE